MTNIRTSNIKKSIFALSVLAVLLIPTFVNATPESDPYKLIWIDNFDDTTLDSRWAWVREDPAFWSLTTNPGYLQITAQNGGLHGTGGDQENILLTPAPSGDFMIITKLDFAPYENYQIAGLLIYEDEDNYLYLGRGYADGSKVRFRNEIDGITTTETMDVPQTSIYLRIIRDNNIYFGFYSLDGSNWEFVGVQYNDLLNPGIGVGATPGLTQTEIPVDFDFIQLEVIPYNTIWEDDFNETNLDDNWSWVREDDSLWSLTNVPGFMQLTSEGDIYQENNDAKNVLLTEPRTDNFQITTKVTVSPTINYQAVSLLVYQDDDNYIANAIAYANGPKIRYREESSGVISTFDVDLTGSTVYLRITKKDTGYKGYYSFDGIQWIYLTRYAVEFTDPHVGIIAEEGGTATQFVADFNFFQIEYFMNYTFLPLALRE
jgi:beta-xylosidase